MVMCKMHATVPLESPLSFGLVHATVPLESPLHSLGLCSCSLLSEGINKESSI
jgi:hypothetical protein